MKKEFKVGDKIKSFTIIDIVKGCKKVHFNGSTIKATREFMLLRSDKGQERVLEVGKTKLTESVQRYTISNKWKYISFNQLEIVK